MTINFRLRNRDRLAKLVLQNRKRFNKPVNILVRADPAGIQHERVVQLVALQNRFFSSASRRRSEALVERIVNHRNALRIQVEDVEQIVPRGVGNRENLAGCLRPRASCASKAHSGETAKDSPEET